MKIAKTLMLIMSLLIMLAQPAFAIGNELNTNPLLAFVNRTSWVDPHDIESVNQALQDWIEAISYNDPYQVTSLYEKDAVLLPTLSPKVLTTSEERESYFDKLFTQDLPHAQVQLTDEPNIAIFRDSAVASGLYEFSSQETPDNKVPARYTFVYRRNDYPSGWGHSPWTIVQHHSAKLPN